MQPQEVLALIHSAPKRFESVRATLRYRGDGTIIKALREEYLRSEAGRLEAGSAPEPSEKDHYTGPGDEPNGCFGWRCRVWFAKGARDGARFASEGDRYRLELELPQDVVSGNGLHISAWDGRAVGPHGTDTVLIHRTTSSNPDDDPLWVWLAQDSYWTTYLFDPDGIAGLTSRLNDLDLEVQTPVFQAGRQSVRLTGATVEEWAHDPDPLLWGADEYEVVVDAERGVLLRCASRLAGEDIEALEVEEIVFDAKLPEGVFTARQPLA